MKYTNILLALELEPKSDDHIVKKAVEIAEQFKAKITLIHAIEYLSNYGAAYGMAVGVDIEDELRKDAEKRMKKLGEQLNIPKSQQILKTGPAKHIILEEAEKMGANLIVLGSHGRQGVRLLLGSTANAVLHGAPCDVLAVRVKEG